MCRWMNARHGIAERRNLEDECNEIHVMMLQRCSRSLVRSVRMDRLENVYHDQSDIQAGNKNNATQDMRLERALRE